MRSFQLIYVQKWRSLPHSQLNLHCISKIVNKSVEREQVRNLFKCWSNNTFVIGSFVVSLETGADYISSASLLDVVLSKVMWERLLFTERLVILVLNFLLYVACYMKRLCQCSTGLGVTLRLVDDPEGELCSGCVVGTCREKTSPAVWLPGGDAVCSSVCGPPSSDLSSSLSSFTFNHILTKCKWIQYGWE